MLLLFKVLLLFPGCAADAGEGALLPVEEDDG
jgi:hypothetical protein